MSPPVSPTDRARRSLVYRIAQAEGATFAALDDAALVEHYGDAAAEADAARRLGLADLSGLPRVGFKGADAPQWLREHGIDLPPRANQARRQRDASLVARLSQQEHLVLASLAGHGVQPLESAWSMDLGRRCYHLPRAHSHCWFATAGEHTSAMLAKLCAVDLRRHRFADGNIAQTSLARITAIAVRADMGGVPAFHLLADIASAEYLWGVLADAMQEFDGAPVGLRALRALG